MEFGTRRFECPRQQGILEDRNSHWAIRCGWRGRSFTSRAPVLGDLANGSDSLRARFLGRRFVDHAESVLEKPIPSVVAISKPFAVGRSIRPSSRVVALGADSC